MSARLRDGRRVSTIGGRRSGDRVGNCLTGGPCALGRVDAYERVSRRVRSRVNRFRRPTLDGSSRESVRIARPGQTRAPEGDRLVDLPSGDMVPRTSLPGQRAFSGACDLSNATAVSGWSYGLPRRSLCYEPSPGHSRARCRAPSTARTSSNVAAAPGHSRARCRAPSSARTSSDVAAAPGHSRARCRAPSSARTSSNVAEGWVAPIAAAPVSVNPNWSVIAAPIMVPPSSVAASSAASDAGASDTVDKGRVL